MLQKARQNARQHQVQVIFAKHDARALPYASEFDLAIMLCGGAFPLMETDEMNYCILENAFKEWTFPTVPLRERVHQFKRNGDQFRNVYNRL